MHEDVACQEDFQTMESIKRYKLIGTAQQPTAVGYKYRLSLLILPLLEGRL